MILLNNKPLQMKKKACISLSLFMLFFMNIALAEVTPKLKLFPTAVKEDLKLAVAAATNRFNSSYEKFHSAFVEKGEMYKELGCDGSVSDAGCQAILQQMADVRAQFAKELKDKIPELQKVVKSAHNSLGKAIRKASNNMTMKQKMELLAKGTEQSVNLKQIKVRKGKKMYITMSGNINKLARTLGSRQANNADKFNAASGAYQGIGDVIQSLDNLEQAIEGHEMKELFRVMIGKIDNKSIEEIETINQMVDGDEQEVSELPDYQAENELTTHYNNRINW